MLSGCKSHLNNHSSAKRPVKKLTSRIWCDEQTTPEKQKFEGYNFRMTTPVYRWALIAGRSCPQTCVSSLVPFELVWTRKSSFTVFKITLVRLLTWRGKTVCWKMWQSEGAPQAEPEDEMCCSERLLCSLKQSSDTPGLICHKAIQLCWKGWQNSTALTLVLNLLTLRKFEVKAAKNFQLSEFLIFFPAGKE